MAKIPLVDLDKELGDFIAKQIDTYEKELTVNIDETLNDIANDFKDQLYFVTPLGKEESGKYGHLRDNLTVSGCSKGGHKNFIVHFGKKGWLSTLMEYGWTLRNGNSFQRKNTPFIRPTFEKNKERYFKWIKEAVEKQVGDK